MHISEAIRELQRYKDEHGDIEVVNDRDEPVEFEFNDDGGEPAVLIA